MRIAGFIMALVLSASLARAQAIEATGSCTNGAGVAFVPVCVGETVTCTAGFKNVDAQDWTVVRLATTIKHPSGDEGGQNLLSGSGSFPLMPGADVNAAGVFVARAEDMPNVTVEVGADAFGKITGFGVSTLNVEVEVIPCTAALLRTERRAYRKRMYRATCTNEGNVRVCRSGSQTFTGIR